MGMSEKNIEWLGGVYDKIQKKTKAEVQRNGDKIVYIADNGIYKEDKAKTDIYWWTNGFWAGIMWQMYNATGDCEYRSAAEGIEAKLDRALERFIGLHHDVGFIWLHTAVANYRLTGSKKSLSRGLHAANILAGRYNPFGKYICAWNENRPGWMIIDSMMNIPLLHWASKEIDDPRFYAVAVSHADTALRTLVREDGSCSHIAILDPNTGELLETPGGQGYEAGSSWSRGQAWALYGYALSYRYTDDIKYIEAAKKIANYFIANVRQTGFVPLADFRAPAEPVIFDTTAGAIAASGLIDIALHLSDLEKPIYLNAAIGILKALEEKYCDWKEDADGIVQNGKVAYHDEGEFPIIYGDYFFIEAVLKLLGKSFRIW